MSKHRIDGYMRHRALRHRRPRGDGGLVVVGDVKRLWGDRLLQIWRNKVEERGREGIKHVRLIGYVKMRSGEGNAELHYCTAVPSHGTRSATLVFSTTLPRKTRRLGLRCGLANPIHSVDFR